MINLTQTTYSKGKNDEMLYHRLIPAVAFDYADGDALVESENKVKFLDPTTNKEFTNPLKYTDVKQFDDAGKPVVSANRCEHTVRCDDRLLSEHVQSQRRRCAEAGSENVQCG